jgi:hypothetical protein
MNAIREERRKVNNNEKGYYCLKCGHTFILNGTLDDGKIEDGRNCPICKGPLVPVKLTLAPEPKHEVPVPPKLNVSR